ncbi:MAG: tRNA pseudouridine(13) synthase TruD [Promethearchaeota archaeon]
MTDKINDSLKDKFNENLNLKNKPAIERNCGIEIFSTNTPPLGGEIKKHVSDFIVREITPDGKILNISTSESKFRTDFSLSSKKHYTHFVLIKEEEDTIIAAELIAKALGVPMYYVTWAGLKDNRAITAQRMCVKGDYAKELANLDFENLKIKDIHYEKHPIRIGDLRGNYFQIIIRNLGIDSNGNPIPMFEKYTRKNIKNIIERTIEQIQQKGFPNFFGLQRFGSHRPNSHKIGKLIFLNQIEQAVNEFLLTTYPKENDNVKIARKRLEKEKNYMEALNYFPRSLVYERKLIYELSKDPKNYKKALQSLPKAILKLTLSAYQSYLFNLAVSERVKRGYPLHIPQKNDLISILDSPNGLITPLKYKFGKWYDVYIKRAFELNRATILCNILGYEVRLDNTFFQPIYKEIMDKEGINLDLFKENKIINVQFKGTYRPIFVKPHAFKGQYIAKKRKQKYLIKLEFTLPKGTYATMLLREFIKI